MPIKLGSFIILNVDKGEKPNPCGECSACCTVLSVKEGDFSKDAYTDCQHLLPQGGCSIYDTKPPICTGFHCMYSILVGFRDNERPDKLGIIFAMNNPESHFSKVTGLPLVIAYEFKIGAFKSYSGDKLIRKLSYKMPLALIPFTKSIESKLDKDTWLIDNNTVFMGPGKFLSKINHYREVYKEGRRLYERRKSAEIDNENRLPEEH